MLASGLYHWKFQSIGFSFCGYLMGQNIGMTYSNIRKISDVPLNFGQMLHSFVEHRTVIGDSCYFQVFLFISGLVDVNQTMYPLALLVS